MKKFAALLLILCLMTPAFAKSQAEKLEKYMPVPAHCLGEMGSDRNICKGMKADEWKEYKAEQKWEHERMERAQRVQEDLEYCTEIQKTSKDAYWDSSKGTCIVPYHPSIPQVDVWIMNPPIRY